MATPIWKAAIAPLGRHVKPEAETEPCEPATPSLPENADSAQQQHVLNALPVLVFLERAGRVVFANTEARQTLGLAEGEWVQRPVEDILWGLFPGTAEPQTQLIGSRAGSPFHATMPTRGGRLLPVEGTYSILNPERREAIIVAHASGRVKAPKSRLMEDVLASIPEAVVIVHGNHVLYTNPAFTEMFGYSADEASGANLRELIVPETRQHELAMFENEVDSKGRIDTETVRVTKDGDFVDVALVIAPLRVDTANVGYVLSFRDISDRKQAEEKVQLDALFDVLTGLPNRALFLDRLAIALKRRTRRRDQNCGVMLIAVDRYDEINEALGQATGDALIIAVADRFKACLRREDSASHIARDVFAVLVENILDLEDLKAVAARIFKNLEQPLQVFGSLIRVSFSMGMAIAGPGYDAAEILVSDADFALKRARLNGGGGSEIFDRELEMPSAKNSQDPEGELRRVLKHHNYEVWYQPIYHLHTGKLEGFESLLRLRRPDGSVDSFLQLLGVAEDTGLSITLGRETMDIVCRQLLNWSDAATDLDLTITLNLSERQFYHPEMVNQLRKALAANAVDPARLLFEVTESILNRDCEAAATILQRMAQSKVRIAVDNFGSRFAPLNHLARLPIDVVKLSPKLIAGATSDGRESAVLESMIRLGHTLGMQVVAQGIETQEQLDAMCRMGCLLGQGHLFSYALEPSRATQLAGLGRWALARGA